MFYQDFCEYNFQIAKKSFFPVKKRIFEARSGYLFLHHVADEKIKLFIFLRVLVYFPKLMQVIDLLVSIQNQRCSCYPRNVNNWPVTGNIKQRSQHPFKLTSKRTTQTHALFTQYTSYGHLITGISARC